MNLLEKETGERLEGKIEKVSTKELKALKSSKKFGFNWEKEKDYQVFKISLLKSKAILGLVSVIDFPNELRIHINLLESSKDQRGKNKQVENIPGCLIAFICRESFKKGYEGFVSLLPKTELVDYYHNTYGFIKVGIYMAVLEELSESLIQKYLSDEEV